jgi:acetyl esterase/lipase
VPVWPPAANTFGWTSYLGDAKGGVDVSPYAAAARATDLSGLPPALITVGGVDGFVDENMEYAARLNQAGVPTELHIYPNAPHGFDGIAPQSALAQRAQRDMEEWLGQRLRSV